MYASKRPGFQAQEIIVSTRPAKPLILACWIKALFGAYTSDYVVAGGPVMSSAKPAPSKSAPVSVRLQPALNDQVAAIAASMDRPKSWVIEQAVKDYVALETWRLAAIDEGLRAADEGRTVAHDAVADWVRSWDGPNELAPPKPR